MRFTFCLFATAALASFLADGAMGAAAGVPADYNNDGIVDHADYSVLGDNYGDNFSLANRNPLITGNVGAGDLDYYRQHYGDTSSTPSILSLAITPTAIAGGNVEWTFTVSNSGNAISSLAGHFGIGLDGPGAPNILSITPGALMTDGGVGVPGSNPFGFAFLTPTDAYGNPSGTYYSNTTHNAYAALGTKLEDSFSGGTALTLFTLVTEGQQTTTLRLLGGPGMSEYGYKGTQYEFAGDQVATFAGTSAAAPEPFSLMVWVGLIAATVISSGRRLRR